MMSFGFFIDIWSISFFQQWPTGLIFARFLILRLLTAFLYIMPKDTSIKSILIIGSGPIIIGQACEFDYSGSQAARSLREEGIEVVLINSNPATIMTDKVTADHVYLKPLEKKSIREILEKHHINSLLPTILVHTSL